MDSTPDSSDSYTFELWNTATGTRTDKWTTYLPSKPAPVIPVFKANDGGQFLGIEFETDLPPSFWDRHPWLAKVSLMPSAKRTSDSQAWFVVLDSVQQREVALLPATTGSLSPNNRWLATIDVKGLVKVWEFPLRKPWARILGYSALATLASWSLVIIATRLFPRRKPSAVTQP